jgi:hypothetical protein
MQADFSPTERVELSVWCDWRQPGLGFTSILGAVKVFRLELLILGVALTVWPHA